jgi:integrase
MNYAVKRGILPRNPLKDVLLPRAVDQPPKAWTREQLDRLIAASATDPQQVWLLVSVGTGIRVGEARALLWSDVDLRDRTLSITKSVHAKKNTIGPTKTGKHRVVDLPDELVPVLLAHRARQAPSATYVLGNRHDRPHSISAYQAAITRLCRTAGVPRLTPHSTRHTAASIMLSQNVSPAEVAGQLGHSIATLLTTYAHLINAGERRGAKALGAVFAAPIPAIGAENGAERRA